MAQTHTKVCIGPNFVLRNNLNLFHRLFNHYRPLKPHIALLPGHFFFYTYFYLFIYLSAPGLSCDMWGLIPQLGIRPRPTELRGQNLPTRPQSP